MTHLKHLERFKSIYVPEKKLETPSNMQQTPSTARNTSASYKNLKVFSKQNRIFRNITTTLSTSTRHQDEEVPPPKTQVSGIQLRTMRSSRNMFSTV